MHERHIYVRYIAIEPKKPVCFMFSTEPVDGGQDPLIVVYSPGSVGAGLADPDAVVSLAHELGHQESWLREDASDTFDDLMIHNPRAIFDEIPRLREHEPELLVEAYADEVRAWRYGRAILANALPDFADWSAFDVLETVSLRGYREGWGLSAIEVAAALPGATGA